MGGGGSVVSALIGSLHNLMHTILKTPSAVIARTMGWNCSIVSVSHLSQSQLVGHTNTSPPELGRGGEGGWGGGGWGGGVEMGRGGVLGWGGGGCLGGEGRSVRGVGGGGAWLLRFPIHSELT